MGCTGVAESVTLLGRCRAAGSCALPISSTTLLPVLRKSGAAPAPEKRSTSLPAPPSPRLKSIEETVTASGVRLAGSAIAPVADQDWVRLTQSQFEPVPITPEFWIVPTWHQVPAQARQVIRLDPGLAFGTGTHPTTRMCLRWLAAHPPRGQRVLDYGCGSGILAIGAALHGAAGVDAVDIDPAAVQATQDNAAANGVALRAGLPELAQGVYDTVLANILATPLKVLAPLLAAHVAPGGALVLAGVLERQTDELRQAYRSWLALEVADTEDGWVLLVARRP